MLYLALSTPKKRMRLCQNEDNYPFVFSTERSDEKSLIQTRDSSLRFGNEVLALAERKHSPPVGAKDNDTTS